MQKRKSFVFIVVTVFILLVGGGVYYVYSRALGSTGSVRAESGCKDSYAYTVYKVSIKSDKITPAKTEGHLCDRVVIKNYDDKFRVIAFGQHEDHVAYDGIVERTLKTNGSFEFTLDKTGEIVFHDHLDENVAGRISVTERTD